MSKIILCASIIGLFSVLCFTNCKKKNNDNTPTATVLASTLTDASYGWTITGLTADKPFDPSVPNSTNWYQELGLAGIQPTFMFTTNSTYSLSEDIGYIPQTDNWSLNTANTALTIGKLVMNFTESSDTKIVGKIAYPKYGVNQNQTANLTITLTKNTASSFPLANTIWSYTYPDNSGNVEVQFVSPNRVLVRFPGNDVYYAYTYNSTTNTGTVMLDGENTSFSISGNQLTLNLTDGLGNPAPIVLTKK